MAKNERQKRSARKARQAERAEHEAIVAENAVAQGKDPEKLKEQAAKAQARAAEEKNKKPGPIKRMLNWFGDVISEMRRVVWPTPKELRNYSFAVIGVLLFFGIVVWVVDTGVVAGLVQYSKIGPNAVDDSAYTQTLTDEELAELTEGSSAGEATEETLGSAEDAADSSASDEAADAEATEGGADTSDAEASDAAASETEDSEE